MKIRLTREEFNEVVSKALSYRFKETFGFEFNESKPKVEFSFCDDDGKDVEVIKPIKEIIVWKKPDEPREDTEKK